MEELREEVDAHWAKMKAIRLQQADRNESVMDSDFWRPVVMGFVGGSFIGTAVGLSEPASGAVLGLPLEVVRDAGSSLLAPAFAVFCESQPSSWSMPGRLRRRLGTQGCRGTWSTAARPRRLPAPGETGCCATGAPTAALGAPTMRRTRGGASQAPPPIAFVSACRFFGVYQVTGTALDKFGILSEWSWENAAVSAAVAALPFLRNAASRANLPVFALLVAMERWDKYKVVQRMREEGIKVDTSTGALERV
tara:strand:+ start:398 stop:1150 length:753 start_codon:yes stop_codon:yes gene_type:complete